MAGVVVRGGRVLTPSGWRDADVTVDSGIFAGIGGPDQLAAPAEAVYVDAAGCTVVPGFVDVHVHAAGGAWPRDVDSLRRMSSALARGGVTSFLLTTIAAPLDELAALVALAAAAPDGGARCLGVHLEGPWLSPAKSGAMPVDHFRDLDLAEVLALADNDVVRLVTLAPELPGALDAIRELARRGVSVALGHSDATYEVAMAAFDAGARHLTHAGNAMSGLHHRDPGLLGAAIEFDAATLEVIADGVHVHPAFVRMLWRSVGAERLCLISDGVDGDPSGELVRDGTVLRRPDGRLAGSALTLADSIPLTAGWGIPLEQSVRMASTTPARVAGRDADLGVLQPGAAADLVVLDADLQVRHTVVAGTLVHSVADAC